MQRAVCARAFGAVLGLALLAARPGGLAPSAEAAVSRSRSEPSGLGTLRGVRVLRLGGTPRERGYAHGYHLAPNILAVFTLYRPFLAPDDAYEKRVRAEVRERYHFPPEVAEEIAGMYEGLRAFFTGRDGDERALTEGAMATLGRPFDELDLKCMQTIPDWHPFHCSALVVWGGLSPSGPLVGRNMDFGYHPVLTANHLLIFNQRRSDGQNERSEGGKGERAEESKAWVSLTFPGIVGAITGVNEDGVCVFTLDANGPLVEPDEACPPGEKMLPRLLALRRILERAGAGDPARDAMELLKGTYTRWGQNIFIAGPKVAENPATAGVLEQSVRGTRLRTAAADPVSEGVPAFACTNHFRRLARPVPCARYDTIVGRMKELRAAEHPLTQREALRLLWDVKQRYQTMQTIVVRPATRDISLRLFAEPLFLTKPRVIRLRWREIAPRAARRGPLRRVRDAAPKPPAPPARE